MMMAMISPSSEANSASRLALRGRTEGLRRLRDVDWKSDFCFGVSLRRVKIGVKVGHKGVWDPPIRPYGVARGLGRATRALGAPWLPCGPPLACWKLLEC